MSTPNPFATTPFFAQWFSLAETATGAWQKALAGDLARQSADMVMAFNRHMLSAWTAAWAPAGTPPAAAPAAAEAAPAPVAMAVEPAVEASAEMADEPEKPRRAVRAKAQPLATPQRRKSAPAITAKLPRGRRVTRH
jgi:hypothetical protein